MLLGNMKVILPDGGHQSKSERASSGPPEPNYSEQALTKDGGVQGRVTEARGKAHLQMQEGEQRDA